MHRNPIVCDCKLEWLVEKIRLQQLNFIGICSSPSALQKLPINQLIRPHLGGCSSPKTELIDFEYANISSSSFDHNLHAIVGSSMVISCSQNQKTADLIWKKNGHVIKGEEDRIAFLSNGSLWIQTATEMHEGVYTCGSTNSHVLHQINLTIDGIDFKKTIFGEIKLINISLCLLPKFRLHSFDFQTK